MGESAVLPKGWERVRLGEIAQKCSKKNREFAYALVLTNSAQRGIIPQAEHFDKDIAVDENIDGYFVVEDGAFVYNPRISSTAPCGPIRRNHLGKTGVMSPLYTVFKLWGGAMDEAFVEYYFLSSAWYRYMKGIANYGARHDRMSITDNGFFAMPVPCPPIAEQRSIAGVLGAQDRLIDAQGRLIEAKQKQKRWLMQGLLTGETRLPGFDGAWEKVKVGEVCKSFGGGTPSTNDPSYWNGTIPWISSADVVDGNIYNVTMTRFITEFAVNASATKICPKNTILIVSRVGVGKIAIAPHDLCTSQDFTNLSVVNQDVLFVAFALVLFFERHKLKSQGTSIKGLTVNEIKGIVLHLPPMPEQIAIAERLTAADREIELLEKRLQQQRLMKKHLMQLLLTGKIRVKGERDDE